MDARGVVNPSGVDSGPVGGGNWKDPPPRYGGGHLGWTGIWEGMWKPAPTILFSKYVLS